MQRFLLVGGALGAFGDKETAVELRGNSHYRYSRNAYRHALAKGFPWAKREGALHKMAGVTLSVWARFSVWGGSAFFCYEKEEEKMKRIIALFLACVMLCFVGCAETKDETSKESPATTESNATSVEESSAVAGLWADALYTENTELGEGAKTVTVEVIAEDKTVVFTIHTDAATLGEALMAHKLVEGDQGDYGLYIKKVNGIQADYDKDKHYWGFYKNGEMMMTGVDGTAIADGEKYELKREK